MSTRLDYSVGQKIIHWLMTILIVLDLFVAQKFGGELMLGDRLESRADHGSLGSIVAVLFLIRIYLRVRYGAPQLPTTTASWQVTAATWGHGLLYFLIGFLILSGVATAMNAASPIALFGALDITQPIGQTDETTFAFVRQFHEFATNAVIALIVIHVVAAGYHLLIARDKTTQKMLKFWSSTDTSK